jgi:hypothetical protein
MLQPRGWSFPTAASSGSVLLVGDVIPMPVLNLTLTTDTGITRRLTL